MVFLTLFFAKKMIRNLSDKVAKRDVRIVFWMIILIEREDHDGIVEARAD